MQLSLMFKRPLHEILTWPTSHLRLWAAWIIRERTPLERIEMSIAQLCAIVANVNRKKGSKAMTISDFMLFKDVWKQIPKSGDESFDHDLNLLVNALSGNG